MIQATKRELKPKLRFPEFGGAWAVKKLVDLGKLIGGGTPDKSVVEYWQGDIPWVSSSDIFEDDIYTISVTRFINEKSISESATKIVPKGSVLFVSRVGTGKLAVNNNDVCTSQDFTNFLPKKIYNYFLGYFFIANKSALISLGQGTSIKGFSKGDLEKFEVIFPSLLEQQKIADCLSSIDELITAQTQKLVTLKTHKKGLMQQLFPAEGETLPKLRFPEFRDDWVIAKLGELGKLSGGGTPDKSVAEYWQGDIPWVSSSDVFEDDIYTMSVTRFINEKSISESATKIVPKGSVLFVSRVGTGKLAVNNIDVCTSQDFTNFLPKKIYNYFLGYFFIANKSALISLGQGTSIKGFSKGDLEQFEVSFPSSLEQQKIADCLSSIDDLIIAQTKKIDTLKTHKKGLMQQLFPAIEEVQR